MPSKKGELSIAEAHRLIDCIQNNPHNCAHEKSALADGFGNLVHSIAQQYRSPKADDYDDLTQVGFVGLLDAAKKFDSTRGVKFSTFAFSVIKGSILNYLSSEAKHYNNQQDSREISLNVDDAKNGSFVESVPVLETDDSFEDKLIAKIEISRFRPRLVRAIKSLPERQKTVVKLFYYDEDLNSEIALKLNVSRPRVNALLNDALNSLRKRLQIAA